MADRKAFLFPLLLFATFFLLVALTGFFQLRVINKNMNELLKNEGEIVSNHIIREINFSLEYLGLVEKAPSLITPNFLNVLAYDETILEDLYNMFYDTKDNEIEKIPLSNFIVIDKDGRTIKQRGNIRILESDKEALLRKKQETIISFPDGRFQPLSVGFRAKDNIVFFSLDSIELDNLRKKYIIREILEREAARFNITGIGIYDKNNAPYILVTGKKDDAFLVSKTIDSFLLPDYRIDVYISKDITNAVLKRTSMSFISILIFLFITGTSITLLIFIFERRYDKKMRDMEKEIAKKERLVSLGNLASGMAHEIRNPLNAINLSVQRLKREFMPSEEKAEEYKRFIDIMRGEIMRVDKIVEEFLTTTRSQAAFINENLYNIIEETVIILGEHAASKGVKIINNADTSLMLECQKERLKQAFYNIILNGIQAIEGDGTINISTATENGFIEISIEDTGVGIKKEDLNRIFDYYYTTKEKGIGIGLPISYMIIKDHGGDIKVTSTEGRGTVFVLTIPEKSGGGAA